MRLREGRSRILEPTGPPTGRRRAGRRGRCWWCRGWRPTPPGTGWAAAAAGTTAREPASRDLETWLLLNDDEVLEVVPTDIWDLPVDLLVDADAGSQR